MTPAEAIASLAEAGWSETAIADKVRTSQSSVNRIAKGQQPNYELGKALVDLARRESRRSSRATRPLRAHLHT